ncbi:MAG: DnaJ domain-containing protein [Kofleriaceae bacterium]
MFLKASAPPAIGTSVRIDLTLPSASVIVLTGVVQHHVSDATRGQGVELKLAPIPTGSIWLIESALASEQRRQPTPSSGTPSVLPPTMTGPVAAIGDGNDVTAAEDELIRALMAEAESLKKLNPFLVLGVGYEANDGDVRSAFGELTKRYHPDRFARYESVELRGVAAEIFILIRDAYRKLVDETSRLQALSQLGRSTVPRAVPGPRAPASHVGPPPPPGMRTTQAIPIGPAPRAITDAKSGAVRAVTEGGMKTGPVRIPIPNINPVVSNSGAIRKPEPPTTERRPVLASPPPVISDSMDASAIEQLVDDGRLDDAIAAYKVLAKKQPGDRSLRAGIELCEGLRALGDRDRLEAAQRFESALEIDPSNERAARELADMRRQATNERKGLLSRLMGKRET